ncbi:bromodomain-containing protein DDB_G0280777-like isoform X2 [Clytia hemisphaerica]
MVKDEELLLVNTEQGSNSDSDEVVEEFKLPPKQPKRSRKKRKHLPDTRVQSGSSIISWRCCFTFIILSILISGGLVLAFFIYNMHDQIGHLKTQIEYLKGNSNTLFSKHEQKINDLESKHSMVNSFQDNHQMLVKKLETLSAKVKELDEGKSRRREGDVPVVGDVDHQLTTLKTDIESLQSSAAKAEATLSGTQQTILKTLKALSSEIDRLKEQGSSTDNALPNPTPRTVGYMTRTEVEALLKDYSLKKTDTGVEGTSTGDDGASSPTGFVSLPKEIASLQAELHTFNVTHNQDLIRLAKNMLNVKQGLTDFKAEFTSKYEPVIGDLRKATQDVFGQLVNHNQTFIELKEEIRTIYTDINAVNASITNQPRHLKTRPTTQSTINTLPETVTGVKFTQASPHSTPTTAPHIVLNATAVLTTAQTPDNAGGPNLPDETTLHQTDQPVTANPTTVTSQANETTAVTSNHTSPGEPKPIKNQTESDFSGFKTVSKSTSKSTPFSPTSISVGKTTIATTDDTMLAPEGKRSEGGQMNPGDQDTDGRSPGDGSQLPNEGEEEGGSNPQEYPFTNRG